MINMTLTSLRNTTNFFDIDDVATIVNGRKKEEIGYFVPKVFKEEFEKFTLELQKKRKRKLLQKVLKASRKDAIEDGTVSDGIK
ncbi:MAG: hypothetical protein U9O56_01660 [Campylobacterota bacterium]|nr:hypothetical protein [Campylobacterota bacterium]